MTGVRVPLCPIPAGYVPHHEEHGPDWSNPWSCAASFVTALRRCVNGPDQAPINVPTSPTVDQSRISPVCKLSFDAEPHDPPSKSAPPDITAAEQQLLVKTLSASKSKLEPRKTSQTGSRTSKTPLHRLTDQPIRFSSPLTGIRLCLAQPRHHKLSKPTSACHNTSSPPWTQMVTMSNC